MRWLSEIRALRKMASTYLVVSEQLQGISVSVSKLHFLSCSTQFRKAQEFEQNFWMGFCNQSLPLLLKIEKDLIRSI